MQEWAAVAGHCMGPSWVVVDQFGCGEQQEKASQDQMDPSIIRLEQTAVGHPPNSVMVSALGWQVP